MTPVSITKALYMRKSKKDKSFDKKDLVASYRNRSAEFEKYSLEDYFYKVWKKEDFWTDKDTKREKSRILVPKGLHCRPKYPIDYDYARGMLVMHLPWSKRNPINDLLNDKPRTIQTFREMVGKRLLPLHVLSEFSRAVKYSQQHKIEALAKEGTTSDKPSLPSDLTKEEMDEQLDYWEHSRHFSNNTNANVNFGSLIADIGLNHDWSKSFFNGVRASNIMDGELWTDYVRKEYYNDSDPSKLDIPRKRVVLNEGSSPESDQHAPNELRHELKDYEMQDLTDEQQIIVLSAIDTVIKFLTNDPDYKPMRATILGCGGTGKSHIINTIISIIRRYTNCNDVIKVAAPSGGAAYNVKGCTLHRGLDLSVDKKK